MYNNTRPDQEDYRPESLGIKCPECGVGPGDDCRTWTGGSYMALSGGSDVSGIERGLHFARMDEWIRLNKEQRRKIEDREQKNENSN